MSTTRFTSYLLIAVPVVCFALLLTTYAVNVPWMDDIEAFIHFLLNYRTAESFSERLFWLLKPNNEHRILMGKLVTVGTYYLTGVINFRWLILLAGGLLAGLLVVLYRVFRSFKLPLLYFLPVFFVLLQPQYYLTSMWAITAFQHQTTACLVIGSLYLLSKPAASRLGGALFLQVLTSFSMSNGLFGWVGGAVVLFLRRRYIPLVIWLVVGVVTGWLYFRGFANPQGNESSIDFLIRQPYIVVAAFFTTLGGLLDFMPDAEIFRRSILPTIAGLIWVVGVVYMLWAMGLRWPFWKLQSGDKVNTNWYFFIGCYAFLFVNAGVVALLRPRFGYHVMLVSNYKLYPALLVALLYLNGLMLLVSRSRLQRWVVTSMVSSFGVWLVSYFVFLPRIAERKQQLLAFAFNQQHNGSGLGGMVGTYFGNFIQTNMTRAEQEGIYRYPEAFYTNSEEELLKPANSSPNSLSARLEYQPPIDSYQVDVAPNSLNPDMRPVCIVAKSAERTYLFPSTSQFAPGPFFLNRAIPVVRGFVLRSGLQPGEYQLGVVLLQGSQAHIRYADQRIRVQ